MGIGAATALHDVIDKNNILQKPTEQITQYFIEHSTLYKAALLANHFFRALSMDALCVLMPFSPLVNLAICFGGSLFYRLTVETNCAYKFALPAFAGSIAIPLGAVSLANIVTGVAFASLSTFGLAVVCLLPLASYVTYIVLTVNYDVENRL